MDGKHVVITGATGGIGQASAIALAKSGARITLVARSQEKAENTLREIKAVSGRDDHRYVIANFSSLDSVRKGAEEILSWGDKIDVLQNNAGYAAPERRETVDGFEENFAVNHLAPFLLTGLLLPLILNEGSRIVNVGSHSYSFVKGMKFDDLQSTNGFRPLKTYSYSKLANNLFTIEIANRLKSHGVTCNVLHPGTVNTNLGAEGTGIVISIVKFLNKYAPALFKTPEQGAATSNYLCQSDEVANVTGKYFVNCKQVQPKPWGEDMEAAKRLWTLSEEMTGFTYQEL
jgi:NAD(P)-dependent dehydrogenase (short-subunit alcohol dehydrogenase family)